MLENVVDREKFTTDYEISVIKADGYDDIRNEYISYEKQQLNTTLAFCIESLKHSCCGFIDFSKAFDKIDRETLYRKMKQCNISSKFLNLIKTMYSQFKSCVRTSDETSEYFCQEIGVLQGESLSPTLFPAYIN